MADKKTAKTVKSTKQVTPIADRPLEQLQKDLDTVLVDLHDAKKSHAAGELVNPRVLTMTRREVARLKTAIRARQLTAAKEEK